MALTVSMAGSEVTLTSVPVSMLEGTGGQGLLTFSVRRSPAGAEELRIPYALGDGGTATPGVDFVVPEPGEFIFPPGSATASVSVTIKGDSVVEPDESLRLRLMPPKGVRVMEKWRVCTPTAWTEGMSSDAHAWRLAFGGALACWLENDPATATSRLVVWWRGEESAHQWRMTSSPPANHQPGSIQRNTTMAADENHLALSLGEGANHRLVIYRYLPGTDTWIEEASVPVLPIDGVKTTVTDLHLHGGVAAASLVSDPELPPSTFVVQPLTRKPDGTWELDPVLEAPPPLYGTVAETLSEGPTLVVRSWENAPAGLSHHRLMKRTGTPAAPWVEHGDLAPAGWAPAPFAFAVGVFNDEVTLYGEVLGDAALSGFGRWAGSGGIPLTWTQTGALAAKGSRFGLDHGAPLYLTAPLERMRLVTHEVAEDGTYGPAVVTELPGLSPSDLAVRDGALLTSSGWPIFVDRQLIEASISNDDGLTYRALDAEISEPASGQAVVQIEVQANQRLGSPVTLDWATVPGSAVSPDDFVAGSGKLTIPAGGISAIIAILIEADATHEGPETFQVRLFDPTAGVVGRPEARVLLHDEDVPRVSSDSAPVAPEGDVGAQPWAASVSLTEAPAVATSIPIRLGGTARVGVDYSLAGSTIFWPAGQRTVALPWQGLGDLLTEGEETVTVASRRPGFAAPVTATWLGPGQILANATRITELGMDRDHLAVISVPDTGAHLQFYERDPVFGWRPTQVFPIATGANLSRMAMDDRHCLVSLGPQVLLWRRGEAGWELVKPLTTAEASNADPSLPLALSGSVAVVADNSSGNVGCSVHYRHAGGADAWGLAKRVHLENFGTTNAEISAMALDGDWLVLSRPTFGFYLNGTSMRGAVEVRHRHKDGPDQWGMVERLLNPDDNSSWTFGHAVALSGGRLAVELSYTQDGWSGGVALFERSGPGLGNWSRVATAPAHAPGPMHFVLRDDWLVAAAGSRGDSTSERSLQIRHRDAGGSGNWGVASTTSAPNRAAQHMAFDGHNLLVTSWLFRESTLVVESWEPAEEAILRIEDDDPAPVIMSLNDATMTERTAFLPLPATAQSAVDVDVSVEYEIVPVTARPGSDIGPTLRGTAILKAGTTTFNVPVGVVDDSVPEADETFTVRLTAISQGKIAARSADGTIVDNDIDPRNARVLLPFDHPVRAQVPTAASFGQPWRALEFDDSAWRVGRLGVGFETEPASSSSYTPFLGLDLRAEMFNVASSVLLRLPFDLPDPLPTGGRWSLRTRADDGMALWINGEEILRERAPQVLAWNSTATENSQELRGLPPTSYTLQDPRRFLRPGSNLGAVHGLNRSASSSDLLLQIEIAHLPLLDSSYLDWMTSDAGATGTNYWPADDADHDGFTNGHEYVAGTRPLSAGSQPSAPALIASRTFDGTTVLAPGFGVLPLGARVEIQTSASLAPRAWSVLAVRASSGGWQVTPPVAVDDAGRLVLPPSPGVDRQYFRCVIDVATQ
jgi:hypothetical protein